MAALHNPKWDVLAILGDVAVDFNLLEEFFYYKVPQDIPVLFVPGNHEFEGKEYHQTLQQLQDIFQHFPNVTLLHNKAITIQNVKFIGSTLWTNFDLHNTQQESMAWADLTLGDFKRVRFGDTLLNAKQTTKLFDEAYRYLQFEIKQPHNGPRIVLSHFAPHAKSVHPKYQNTDSSYFASDLSEFAGLVDIWIHGHTHTSFNYTDQDTLYLCNPRGNAPAFNLAGNTEFDPNTCLQFTYDT